MGARIRVQNEEVVTREATMFTDELGEAFFPDLAAGRWKFRATAPNHQELIGRFRIKPGITLAQEIFLDFNLITVDWSVTEITIQDRYEITLQAVYEVDVPAAVVLIEPPSVTLPRMNSGDVFYGEFTMTNYGLIRADNLKLHIPPRDAFIRLEILSGLPDTLEAKETITVPYRVTQLSPFEPDGTTTGGGALAISSVLRRRMTIPA